MVTQQERKILSAYQKIENILTQSYLTDFVLMNPTNFPISSYIMKFCINCLDNKNIVLKDFYTRISVINALNYAFRNGNADVLIRMSDAFDQNCFTMLILILPFIGNDFRYFSIITEIGEDYLISFSWCNFNVPWNTCSICRSKD